MYENNIKRQQRIDKMIEYVSSLNYGDMIPYSDIKNIIGVNPQTQEGYLIMTKVNHALVTKQMHLKTIMGKGRRLLNPSEHLDESRNKVKKALNPIKDSKQILESTNIDKLTDEQKKEVISEANKWKIMVSVFNEVRKQPMILSDEDAKKYKIDKFKILSLFKG